MANIRIKKPGNLARAYAIALFYLWFGIDFKISSRKCQNLSTDGILIFSSGEWTFFKVGPIEIMSIPG